jgi:hypothetical protein
VRQARESLTEIIEDSRSKDSKWSAMAGRQSGATRLLSRFFVSVVSGDASILHVAPWWAWWGGENRGRTLERRRALTSVWYATLGRYEANQVMIH